MPLNLHTYAIYLNPPTHPDQWVVMRTRNGAGLNSKPWIVVDSYR
jgi:hypothetical protein